MARAAYVYYRVRPDRATEAAARIDALLDALAPHCAHRPRRARRCDEAALWMEIYDGISDWQAFEAALAAEVRRLSVARFVDGARHIECFAT